jgi:hypothetical protein
MENNELKFYWIPFDSQITNSIPEELNSNELENFLGSLKESIVGLNLGDIEKAGLFIARKKTGEGFTRYITKTLSPLTFEVAVFDQNFNQIGNFENIQGKELDFRAYTIAVSGISKFTQNDEEEEEDDN